MAALVPKYTLAFAKRQTISAAPIILPICQYSTSPKIIKNPTTASLKRGPGGRSSFNGIVCTVFGANGFLGTPICARLGKLGTQLILPYRGEIYYSFHLKLCGDLGQVLFHPFDLRDEESIIRCMKHSNVVINLIGRDYQTSNFPFKEVHVDGPRRLARLAKQCNVERFIHVSTIKSNPNPQPIIMPNGSLFLKSKWEGEQAVKEEFPEATIVKCSDIYGTGDRYLTFYGQQWNTHFKWLPLWKHGECTEKQPVFVSDVVSGISRIVTDPSTAGKTYQFVGPKRYKLRELSRWMSNILHGIYKTHDDITVDMKYLPTFALKVFLCELCYTGPFKGLHWERLEVEHTSDVITKTLPTLEDFGITLTEMENQVPWELYPFRNDLNYTCDLNEETPPVPPQTIPVL